MASDGSKAYAAVVEMLTLMADVRARLAAEHSNVNVWGRACGTPGRGTPHVRFPCSRATLAARAEAAAAVPRRREPVADAG